MNGYSKINGSTTTKSTKSRSIDFSDLSFPPPLPKPTKEADPNPTLKVQQPQTFTDLKQEEEEGEMFGVILSRTCSVSSSCSQRFKAENSSSIQSAVRSALSMRRSSSVSEGYCRIHDQSDHLFSPPIDGVNMQTRSRKKRGRILKACKRLFGLFN